MLISLRLNDEPGKLAALQAQEKLAEITFNRDKKQFEAQAVAQATIDADTANLQNMKAQIAQDSGADRRKADQGPVQRPYRRAAGRSWPVPIGWYG